MVIAITLTPRQQQLLDYLVQHVKECGFPPTVREIGRALAIASPQGVATHLAALERKGRIKRRPGLPRAIQVLRVD